MGSKRTTAAIITAFAAIYVIWGSTYLVIRFAIETLPPLLMAGVRFTTAGILLFAFLKIRGVQMPTVRQAGNTAITGALLLLAGNGGVSWAEQYIPSGIVALVNATIPCWMVLLGVFAGGKKPGVREIIALVIGAAGVALLAQSESGAMTMAGAPAWAFVVILFGSCSWAVGSLFARGADMPASPFMATAFQMIFGGVFLLLAGLLTGEASGFRPDLVSVRSVLALAYLIVCGSIVAFSAYVWLLRVVQPSQVSSYAYVNPLIAVLLGWLFGNETLTAGIGLAAMMVVAAVYLITITPDVSAKVGRWFARMANGTRRRKLL